MREFRIYANPQGSYKAVKQGWSWPAFFFGFIWALVKKMWVLGFGLIVLFFGLGFIGGFAGGDVEQAMNVITSLGSIVVAIVFGVNGNRWREKNLTSRGFECKDTVTAANGEGAIALCMKQLSLKA